MLYYGVCPPGGTQPSARSIELTTLTPRHGPRAYSRSRTSTRAAAEARPLRRTNARSVLSPIS